MPVPARDEVYEYIIFRGTDIKKIEVCDTPKQPTLPGGLHNDPAIVQVCGNERWRAGVGCELAARFVHGREELMQSRTGQPVLTIAISYIFLTSTQSFVYYRHSFS